MFQTKGMATWEPPQKEASETSVAVWQEASDTSISVSRGLWSMHLLYTL